jgi:hypothetical protein
MTRLYSNNAVTTLSSGITTTNQTTITVTDGSLFPTPFAPDYFTVTITQPVDPETSWEEVKCTARSGNDLTVVRGVENTTASTWSAGSKIEIRWTAAAATAGANVAQVGETVLDFGSAPGDTVSNTTISIAGLKEGSVAEASLKVSTTSDHNDIEHILADIKVYCLVNANTLTIMGVSSQRLTGQFAVQYVYLL